MFYKIGVLKISQIPQEIGVLESLFNIKKRLQQRCFPVKFAKFLRPPQVAASYMTF